MRAFFSLILVAALASGFAAHGQGKQFVTVLIRSGPDLVKLLLEKRADLTVGIVAGTVVAVGDHSMQYLFGGDKSDKDKPAQLPADSRLRDCTSLSALVSTCAGDVAIGGAKVLPKADYNRVIADAQAAVTNIDNKKITDLLGSSDFQNKRNNVVGQRYKYLFDPNDRGVHAADPTRGLLPEGPSQWDKLNSGTPLTRSLNLTLGESLSWTLIENSSDPKDFESYLSRFPTGVHAAIAQQRVTLLRHHSELEGCPSSEASILAPIRSIYAEANERDVYKYAMQWADEMELVDWNINQVSADQVTVHGKYVAELAVTSGRRARDQATGIYNLVCAKDGQWRIAENSDDH